MSSLVYEGCNTYLWQVSQQVFSVSSSPGGRVRKWHSPLWGFILALAWMTGGEQVMAQQVPQYLFSPYSLIIENPAATGMQADLVLTGGMRRQWMQLPGQPEGFHFQAQAGLPFVSSGVGLGVQSDRIGLFRHLEVAGSYSYSRPFGRNGDWMAGVSAGWFQSSLDGSAIRTPDGQYLPDQGPDHRDDLLSSGTMTGGRPILHAGVAIRYGRLITGLSVRHLLGGEVPLASDQGSTGWQLQRHIYMHGAYAFGSGDLSVRPMVQMRTDAVRWQWDGMIYAVWRERFTAGGGIRGGLATTADAWILAAGIRISDRFLLMYAFEQGISSLRKVHNGSFELLLRYEMGVRTGKGVLPPRVYSPRFL